MIQKQKGCNDIYGREAKVWKYVDTVIDALMEKYNYNYIRTPIFEATELFHRGVGETTDIVTKESYDFNMKRANLDIQKYLVDNRLGPTEYIKYYKDDLKLIKK